MRIRTIVTTLFVTLMLVVSADYVAFAATGKSLLLGKTNSANKVTTVKRTTPGPAMKFQVKKPNTAPFATNGKKRVKNLNADRVDGRHGSALAGRSKVSVIDPPECRSLDVVIGEPVKIADLGTFTGKGTKFVDVEFTSFFRVAAGAATGVVFELRIDDASSSLGDVAILLREKAQYVNAVISGVFRGVGSGPHTVSLWTSAANGSASFVGYDSGCFIGYWTSRVTVKQFD